MEEDEELYVKGWLNNNKLLGPFESSKQRGATAAVGLSSSGQGLAPGTGLGLTKLLRANQKVYGTKAEVQLYFEEYRDMMMAACPPLHLYGAKGLKRYRQHTLSMSSLTYLSTYTCLYAL